MRRHLPTQPLLTRRRREEGGLLIVLMVGVTVIFIGLSVAVQAWSVVWRRDSEEELIFRGKQYSDAIIAYQKEHNGQYPLELDILAKEGPRRVRYIRKLFRDPINPTGQWGLLYLMPGGNAIYDPVAAQRAATQGAEKSDALAVGQGGVTQINDLFNTGAPGTQGVQAGTAVPGSASGGTGQLLGGQVGALRGRTGSAAALNQMAGGLRGQPATGMPGMAGMAGSFTGGALPPPKPATGTFDDDSPSEPPIGWPIVGVISRVEGVRNEKTYKVYEGHDKVNQWQFHVFKSTLLQAMPNALPGGSQAPFSVGPGFGGKGKVWNQGPGGGGGRQIQNPNSPPAWGGKPPKGGG